MWTPFAATFRGRDVFSYQQVPRSGVKYSLLLEWFLAARWAGYKWDEEFSALDGDQMAFIVAAYRVHHQIEAVTAWWQTRKHRPRRQT